MVIILMLVGASILVLGMVVYAITMKDPEKEASTSSSTDGAPGRNRTFFSRTSSERSASELRAQGWSQSDLN